MREVLLFTAGLILALLFAAAILTALAGTFVLAKDVIVADGDAATLEARIRHYTDRLEQAPDGSLVLHRAAHPVAQFVGMVAGAWLAAAALGVGLGRIRRHLTPVSA